MTTVSCGTRASNAEVCSQLPSLSLMPAITPGKRGGEPRHQVHRQRHRRDLRQVIEEHAKTRIGHALDQARVPGEEAVVGDVLPEERRQHEARDAAAPYAHDATARSSRKATAQPVPATIRAAGTPAASRHRGPRGARRPRTTVLRRSCRTAQCRRRPGRSSACDMRGEARVVDARRRRDRVSASRTRGRE